MRLTPEKIDQLQPNEVFVFGSNLAGIHGGGAAVDALKFGAVNGIGEGLSGQTYALPTKDYSVRTRSLPDIYNSVIRLHHFMDDNKDKTFMITKVGCGLAGYEIREIAPLFRQISKLKNVVLPKEFHEFLTGESV